MSGRALAQRFVLGIVVTILLPGRAAAQDEAVYLFDCAGHIQRLSAAATALPTALRVAEIDTTLPRSVRDGCAIHAGWGEDGGRRLVLVVQTQAWGVADTLPTKTLVLQTPELTPLNVAPASATPPRHLSWEATQRTLDRIRQPFVWSAGYVLNDRPTALLQELTVPTPHVASITLALVRNVAVITLRRPPPGATGRYRVLDLHSEEPVGPVVSAPTPRPDDRVLCFTPRGRIYLAVARDTIAVLDAEAPDTHAVVGPVDLDLYWSACVVGR